MATTPFNGPMLRDLRTPDVVDFVVTIEDALVVFRDARLARDRELDTVLHSYAILCMLVSTLRADSQFDVFDVTVSTFDVPMRLQS
ncbi:uncharacterized protein PHALS_13822 [Plasmopara halstedii]|uniref:Uncharacterized protein n=1 Tax=Plasmopara halstedii TaxID=4781 RepID=A0A0P1AQY6_PLAHL|nr:uncharacterized protein PHALS_13822 [Plasmopara halstedii]CEG43630.1 hypothetical protein PHALS_13822 [Plasmopara halstedii]|eukprot:XP_024579999.1 hypothetical protein PHALS_13822 [Plasmopara halstedii]